MKHFTLVKNGSISRRKMFLGAMAASTISVPISASTKSGQADAQSILQFSTVAALIASTSSTLTDQQPVMVLNYATSTDLGGGTFVWNANSTAAHDSGVVICPSDRLASVGNVFLHSGNGASLGYAGTFQHKSVQPGHVAIYAGSVTARDNGSGTLFGAGVYGTINYTTGAWSLIYTSPPANTVSIWTNYQYAASPGRWIRQLSSTMNLAAFGLNGFSAWYTAFNSTVGTLTVLEVSAGMHTINRAAFAGTGAMLVVPDGVTIQFDPGAQLNFDYIEAPLFSFLGNASGGISGGTFRYTGVTPNYANPSISKTQFFNYPGVAGKGLNTGAGCDVYALVYSNSSNMVFTGWDVASATPNNEANILPTIIYMHPTSGTVAATNNTVSNMIWRDFQQGWLGYGQSSMTYSGINSDRRAGTRLSGGPGPGHQYYSCDTAAFGGLLMTNCTFENLFDGPNPINYPASQINNIYTLSPKCIGPGCIFNGVVSQHPLGIMVVVGVQNSTFENFTWSPSDTSFIPGYGYGIKLTTNGNNIAGNNNTFSNFTINAPNKPFQFYVAYGVAFNNNTFTNFTASFNNALVNSVGVFDFYGNNNTFDTISITPLTKCGSLGEVALAARGTSTGNSGTITIVGQNSGIEILHISQPDPDLYANNLSVAQATG